MQAQYGAHVVFLRVDDLFVVCVHEEGEGDAVGAERRLDDIGDVFLARLLVKVFHALARFFLMRAQVEVGAVGDAPQLAPAEGEQKLEIRGRLGVVGQLFRLVVAQAQVLLAHVQADQPVAAEGAPVCKPVEVGAGLAEELQLHLLKLAGAESEVSGRDLVAEALADLRDAEGDFAAGGALDILEVDEDALRRFRAQIHFAGRVLRHALERLEHHIEFANVRKIASAAAGAGDAVLADVFAHLLVGQGFDDHVDPVLRVVVLDQLVGAVAHFAAAAVDERVVEIDHVARSDPGLRVHEDGGVKADVVVGLLNELFPPGALYVVFELHAERAVVPRIRKAPVDLRAGVDEAAALAQRDDGLHCFLTVIHGKRSFTDC